MAYIISKSASCAVVGYGSWGTALVKILLENEPIVQWHVANEEVLQHIKEDNINPKYLSSVYFDVNRLNISSDINTIVSNADVIILAVPSAFLKGVLDRLTVSLKNKFVISAIKGIVPNDYVTIAEYMNLHFNLPFEQIGIITGPCHAEEVALERLSYLNIVAKNEENARLLANKFSCDYIRFNTLTDIYGAEYGAVLKNIYAIATGIFYGAGYGDNFLSVLIANATDEMNRFLDETYPFTRNLNTSVYLGDLLVTAYSQFSRNRTFGTMIGKGYSVKSAQIEMNMIAEGYYASSCINHINTRKGVRMPIAEMVYNILYLNKNVKQEIIKLCDQLK